MNKTILIGYDNAIIVTYPLFMDFPLSTILEIETSPNCKPLLTKYRLEKKDIKVSLTGKIEVTYIANKLNDSVEQKYFMK